MHEFSEELTLDPGNGNAAYELAYLEAENGKVAEATREYELALERHPDFEEALVGLAGIDLSSDKAADAVPLLERATRLRPDDEVAWWRLAQADRATGNREEQEKALATFQKIHQTIPGSAAQSHCGGRDNAAASRCRCAAVSGSGFEEPMRIHRITSHAALLPGIAFLVLVAGNLDSCPANAQTPPLNPDLVASKWAATWIASPSAPAKSPGVFYFRKEITLSSVPEHFWVHVSADNRFVLHVNGQYAGEGPARGDLFHWRFETLDLAPLLHAGTNVLAAVVWNFGEVAPVAQMSNRTGFLMQGDTAG